MTKYPLIEAAGLRVLMRPVGGVERWAFVSADDLERVLGEAPVVKTYGADRFDWYLAERAVSAGGMPTHEARLLCSKPITKPDTIDSLVREISRLTNDEINKLPATTLTDYRERFRAVLEARDGK